MKIMSRHERRLLGITLATVLFFGALRYAIIPKFDSIIAKKEEYSQLLGRNAEMENLLKNAETLHSNHILAAIGAETVRKAIPPIMPNEEVGIHLTKLCADYGMNVTWLQMSEAETLKPGGTDDPNEQGDTRFCSVWAKMTLTGSAKSLAALICGIAKTSNLHVIKLSFSQKGINTEKTNIIIQIIMSAT